MTKLCQGFSISKCGRKAKIIYQMKVKVKTEMDPLTEFKMTYQNTTRYIHWKVPKSCSVLVATKVQSGIDSM